jgi:DNA-binding NarL/FixJ family response regulator
MRVFVAASSAAIRERLVAVLEAIPMVELVGVAADVREAIAGILRGKPQLVVLDLKLAHGSGFDVLKEVHAREPGIEVYMFSGFSSEPYSRHAEKLGAARFFELSTNLEGLREAVARRAGDAR